MKIVLVSVGNFQEYMLDNIKNLHLHNNKDITVITEKEFFKYFSEYNIELIDKNTLDDLNFNTNSRLDKSFRNGFWHLCSLRLFYLYTYLIKYNIENCVHIENDVLIYYDLNNVLFDSDKLCACFDCEYRVIPSVIYIPNPSKLKYILDRYDNKLNDMANLAKHDDDIIEKLPIFNDTNDMLSKNFNKYNIIFDAAAIGQYLGGVDQRNCSGDTRGFINETCLIKYNKYEFYWEKINNLYYPFIRINDKSFKIFNLHIHCKQLQNFLSSNPIECKYIKMKN
jgi:hypothetical protein